MRDRENPRRPQFGRPGVPPILVGLLAVIALVGLLILWNNHQAMLVCALERYHRARGDYPATLDALMPDFIQKLPHDLITGQPLNYRRTDDDKFLLYSVGWNEKDDDGLPDKEKGDWVWPTTVTE